MFSVKKHFIGRILVRLILSTVRQYFVLKRKCTIVTVFSICCNAGASPLETVHHLFMLLLNIQQVINIMLIAKYTLQSRKGIRSGKHKNVCTFFDQEKEASMFKLLLRVRYIFMINLLVLVHYTKNKIGFAK